jgi:HD-like signal output (HDOD) protein
MENREISGSPAIRLNARRIPVLPHGSIHLMQSMMDESLNFRQLANIIERFPSIASRLIALSNSVWSSPVSPISSLEQACSRLGFGVVRSTSIALSVSSPFDSTLCPSFDAQRFWCHLMLVADTSTWLALALPGQESLSPLTARAAGLLHDLGLLWLVDQLPDETHQALSRCRENPKLSLSQTLTESIGIDYAAAGRILAETWKLPEPLIAGILHNSTGVHDKAYWQIAYVVNLADCLVSAMATETPCPVADSHLEKLGIRHEHVGNVMHLLYQQKGRTQELASLLFGMTRND